MNEGNIFAVFHQCTYVHYYHSLVTFGGNIQECNIYSTQKSNSYRIKKRVASVLTTIPVNLELQSTKGNMDNLKISETSLHEIHLEDNYSWCKHFSIRKVYKNILILSKVLKPAEWSKHLIWPKITFIFIVDSMDILSPQTMKIIACPCRFGYFKYFEF